MNPFLCRKLKSWYLSNRMLIRIQFILLILLAAHNHAWAGGFTPFPTEKDSFQITSSFPRAQEILEKGKHAVIGVCPFNPRFSVDYLESLYLWAKARFEHVDFLLPGKQTVFLLTTTGTKPGAAQRKVRAEMNRVLRNITLALEKVGETEAKVIRIDDLDQEPTYLSLMESAKKWYSESSEFRCACQEMARQALNSRLKAASRDPMHLTPEQVDFAAEYVLAEIPLFTHGAHFFAAHESVLIYHSNWSIAELLFDPNSPVSVSLDQSFLVVSPTKG